MVVLHPLSDFIDGNAAVSHSSPSYYYEGRCPQTGERLKLPRTPTAEAIAKNLMQHLAHNDRYSHEGKMYGILLVELPNNEQRILKAFSGLLNGHSRLEGWVPPIPGRDNVALEEARTLAELEAIKQELITLKQLPQRQHYETLSREFEQQLQQMSDRHRDGKHQRQRKRQLLCETLTGEALTLALEQLDEESRRHGIERRQLKRQQNEGLQPLKQQVEAADARMRELKQQRKALSRQLQAQMHAAYSVTNFSGQSLSLQQLMPGGSMPTGTGDCCAPKLLHYAATQGLKPLAMAEFWWGKSSGDKVQGEFYGACVERCQPLMGFLLSGLKSKSLVPFDPPQPPLKKGGVNHTISLQNWSFTKEGVWGEVSLPIVYEDEWLIAVNKPAGLLSVPGRYRDCQDSVLSRLRHQLADGMAIMAVHRLDQDTSGILLLARNPQTYRQLSQQFQQRQVHKVYEAVLSGWVTTERGEITLPLWGNPENRPYQQVDEVRGKPSLTRFQVMAREGDYTRIEFIPLTGRTHQLRVHAADARGIGIPILGDRFYGCRAVASRLHLHARELRFEHPQSGQSLYLHTKTPF
ncbi:RluA family pseudouridine synthase [Allocoleopsis franciscana]|uniref:RNA pseudouridylate synthase n=1 Tax=Allocoleopsis franciscana PCC 7113 TaxID=1173027 RepID=K9WMK0_9CYAN|nr:RluA family pseudouridine synthase [Allocoleopsis franciscana]AFZ21615.1 23S RNA-specific pseudouridylate synthase [Allocoleopsis franciscana PCC 7113]